jgi:hypothetical protein
MNDKKIDTMVKRGKKRLELAVRGAQKKGPVGKLENNDPIVYRFRPPKDFKL